MKNIVVILILLFPIIVIAQSYDINGDYKISGNVGIGTPTPNAKLDVKGNGIQIVNPATSGYLYIGRDSDPGNDSYYYSRVLNNFHTIGSNKNGSGKLRGIGFAIGGIDAESDIKMSINTSGEVGIGTTTPTSQFHLASDYNHAFTMSRLDGVYGFRILRDAGGGYINFEIGTGLSSWETKIRIGEGEGVNTKLLLNPEGGNVGIGVKNPTQKLQVAGTVYSTEVKVELAAGQGPDYVFEPDYKLRTLQETKEYITENKHLPEIPSAREMETNGVDLGDMNMRLLKKIEELTLYQIELLEKVEELQSKVEKLQNK